MSRLQSIVTVPLPFAGTPWVALRLGLSRQIAGYLCFRKLYLLAGIDEERSGLGDGLAAPELDPRRGVKVRWVRTAEYSPSGTWQV